MCVFFQSARSKDSVEPMTKLPQMKRSLWCRPLFLPEWIFLDSVDQDASGKRIYCPTGADQRAATGKTSVTKQRQPVILWQAGVFGRAVGREGASPSNTFSLPRWIIYLFILWLWQPYGCSQIFMTRQGHCHLTISEWGASRRGGSGGGGGEIIPAMKSSGPQPMLEPSPANLLHTGATSPLVPFPLQSFHSD